MELDPIWHLSSCSMFFVTHLYLISMFLKQWNIFFFYCYWLTLWTGSCSCILKNCQ
jgi:hypothetical protein